MSGPIDTVINGITSAFNKIITKFQEIAELVWHPLQPHHIASSPYHAGLFEALFVIISVLMLGGSLSQTFLRDEPLYIRGSVATGIAFMVLFLWLQYNVCVHLRGLGVRYREIAWIWHNSQALRAQRNSDFIHNELLRTQEFLKKICNRNRIQYLFLGMLEVWKMPHYCGVLDRALLTPASLMTSVTDEGFNHVVPPPGSTDEEPMLLTYTLRLPIRPN